MRSTLNLSDNSILLSNKNERVEKHGEENKLAVDLDFKTTMPRDVIAEQLLGDERALSSLTGDNCKKVTLLVEFERHSVEVKNMFHDCTLFGCKIKKFVVEPKAEEDKWALEFQVQRSEPSDADLTALAHMMQCDVQLIIMPETQVAPEAPSQPDEKQTDFGPELSGPDADAEPDAA